MADLGRRAEFLAGLWLVLQGFRLLARRYATPFGEIDIVARRGDLLVFVEVKARATREAALDALQPKQRRRIVRAAGLFLQRNPRCNDCRCRFDLITLSPGRLPNHLRGAWSDE